MGVAVVKDIVTTPLSSNILNYHQYIPSVHTKRAT